MSLSPLPAKLAGITEREAVADAVYRGVLAFDHADEDLLRSAITEDAITEFPGVLSAQGILAIKEKVFDRVSKLDTTHFLSNFRVNMESDRMAQVSCSAMAQHCPQGQGRDAGGAKYTSGGLYLCDVIKDGDLWKVKRWQAQMIWLAGDASVMQ